ncbi:MAG: addiction module protein [Chromatiales bacterium]|jgi:hypothetical protein|nr:addiction module protein [Chromatiales bacterium]MDX9768307.1 addiction module protein [Ectothiorhodospiraceae bacterium]
MAGTLPLERMTVEEKLRVMEELWEDLSRQTGSVPVPDWHHEVLEARRRRTEEGDAVFSEWSEVKARLRERTR